jgi:hypothetical protein
MLEEKNDAEKSTKESTEDETKQLSLDAQGLGPRQASPFTVGFVDMVVGKGGLEVPGFVPPNTKSSNWFGTGPPKSSI